MWTCMAARLTKSALYLALPRKDVRVALAGPLSHQSASHAAQKAGH